MPTIDGYNAVGSNPAIRTQYDADAAAPSQSKQPQVVVMSAAGQAYLQTQGHAPVPAFAGPVRPDQTQHGHEALQAIHQGVRDDVNQLVAGLREIDAGSSAAGPSATSTGINFSALIEVLVKLDSEMAKASNEQRTQEYQDVAESMKTQASDIRKGAAAAFTGHMVGAGLTMGAGAASVCGGAASMGGGGAKKAAGVVRRLRWTSPVKVSAKPKHLRN